MKRPGLEAIWRRPNTSKPAPGHAIDPGRRRHLLAGHGRPEIFDTDQRRPFTGEAFTGVLSRNEISIGIDGKGAWRDDVFALRLWRAVRYEEAHLSADDTAAEARASIGRYRDVYNTRRPHASLDRRTPDRASCTKLPQITAA